MGIIEFFDSLTLTQSVLLGIALIIANIGLSFIIFALVKKKYNKERNVEKTLYYQSLLSKFMMIPFLLISTIIWVFLIMPHLNQFEEYGFFVSFPLIMIFALIIGLTYVLVFHKFNKNLRQTTATAKSETSDYFKTFVLIILPIFIAMALSQAMGKLIDRLGIENLGVDIVLSFAPFLLIPIMSLFTIRFVIKSIPLEEGELKEKLQEYLSRNGVNDASIYLWKAKDKKIANALVTGILSKRIYITDYMIEKLQADEIVAILAHEMWHIKKRHVLKRILLALPVVVWALGCGYLFEWIENTYNMELNLFLGISIMLIPIIVFITIGIRYIYRRQEAQADRLTVENGIDPKVFVSALIKLARLNNTVIKFNKLDEKFQTHPSTAKRIRKIMDACKDEDWEKVIEDIKGQIS